MKNLSHIENFIITNGDRFKIRAFKNGLKINEEHYVQIKKIVSLYGDLNTYLSKYIQTLEPEKIEITTKQYNGANSGGRNPKSRIFTISSQSQKSFQQGGLNGNTSTPLESMYQFQIERLKEEIRKETERANKYERLYDEYKEKSFGLDRQIQVWDEKKELQLERERLKNENSLASVFKEIKPELFGLLGNFLEANPNYQSATLEGTDTESNPIYILQQSLSQLPEGMQKEILEMAIRYANSEAKLRGEILQKLRTTSPELDEQINDIL